MRRVVFVLALIALTACGSPAPPQSADDSCERSIAQTVIWSAAEPDTVTATASGPSCSQAIVTLTVRNAAGDPLWAHAGTLYGMSAGGAAPADAAPIGAETVDAFLSGWSSIEVVGAATLPQWREDAATLTESATTFAYETPFDREVYEGMRARDLPMLCFASAVEAVTCLVIDPASGEPAIIASYGP
jgi:hypothetical protein